MIVERFHFIFAEEEIERFKSKREEFKQTHYRKYLIEIATHRDFDFVNPNFWNQNLTAIV